MDAGTLHSLKPESWAEKKVPQARMTAADGDDDARGGSAAEQNVRSEAHNMLRVEVEVVAASLRYGGDDGMAVAGMALDGDGQREGEVRDEALHMHDEIRSHE